MIKRISKTYSSQIGDMLRKGTPPKGLIEAIIYGTNLEIDLCVSACVVKTQDGCESSTERLVLTHRITMSFSLAETTGGYAVVLEVKGYNKASRKPAHCFKRATDCESGEVLDPIHF